MVRVTTGIALGRAKTRVVTLRSRLVRSRNPFEAGLLHEEDYFAEVRMAEHELLGLLREIEVEGGPHAGLRQKIATLLTETQAARANVLFISSTGRLGLHRRPGRPTSALPVWPRSDLSGYPVDRLWRRVRPEDRRCAGSHACVPSDHRRALARPAAGWSLADRSARRLGPSGGGLGAHRRITVVPVLTEGVGLDELRELPDSIAGIRTKQAFTLRPDPDFAIDMERLTSFVARRLL
jgi:hypothetical protein